MAALLRGVVAAGALLPGLGVEQAWQLAHKAGIRKQSADWKLFAGLLQLFAGLLQLFAAFADNR